MKHLRQRNISLLSEFTSYLVSLGCDDIHIDFKTKDNSINLNFTATNPNLTEKNITKLINRLNTPRREDIEEYYWELNGNDNLYCELALIGMMIDTCEVSYIDNILNVRLIRLK